MAVVQRNLTHQEIILPPEAQYELDSNQIITGYKNDDVEGKGVQDGSATSTE